MNETKTLDIYSEEEFYRKIIRHIGAHSPTTKRLLKKHGIVTANDFLTCDELEGVPSHITARLLRLLDEYGYRRDDCSFEKYPILDDYLRAHFHCDWCGSSLDAEANTEKLLCKHCLERHTRVNSKKVLYVQLSEWECDEDNDAPTSIVVDLTIQNNSQIPLLISFDSLILQHNKMRIQSNYDVGSYHFKEGYIIPGEKFTITKGFTNVAKLEKEDYFIITITDKTQQKQYIYKFGNRYRDDDYWEIELNGNNMSDNPAIKQAIENMMRLEIPMEYIQGFRDGATYLIEGKTVSKIGPLTYPKLYAFIESQKKLDKTVVYGVFNEPSMYGEYTDKYIVLCFNESIVNSPLYQMKKQGQICATTAYGWCESTGIAEPTLACFQIANGGVWCLPYPIAKMLSPKIKQESTPKISQEVTPESRQEKQNAFDAALETASEELNLSVREYNILKRSGIETIDDLVAYASGEWDDMLDGPGAFGKKKTFDETVQKLLAHLEIETKPNNE